MKVIFFLFHRCFHKKIVFSVYYRRIAQKTIGAQRQNYLEYLAPKSFLNFLIEVQEQFQQNQK